MLAEAGIQAGLRKNWIPAFAGMTVGAIFPSASSRHVSNPSAYSRGLFNSAMGFARGVRAQGRTDAAEALTVLREVAHMGHSLP